eukprot:g4428.t1
MAGLIEKFSPNKKKERRRRFDFTNAIQTNQEIEKARSNSFKEGKFFGTKLNKRNVDIILGLGQFLSQHRTEEHIFRIPANSRKLEEVTRKMDRGEIPKWLEEWIQGEEGEVKVNKTVTGSIPSISSNISLAASLYKQFFRELPEPIVPNNWKVKEWMKGNNRGAGEEPLKERGAGEPLKEEEERLKKKVMKHLLHVLHYIAQREDVNYMGAKNLAIIFAPNIFKQTGNGTGTDMLGEMKIGIEILTKLIQEEGKEKEKEEPLKEEEEEEEEIAEDEEVSL